MKSWLKGGLIGLIICLCLYLPFWYYSTQATQEARQFYYERFQLCESCGIPRNINCVIEKCNVVETEEYKKISSETIKSRSRIRNYTLEEHLNLECSNHPDIEDGHPEAFINGFCGYSQFIGFNYGKKPTLIGSFFNLHTITEAFDMSGMIGIPLMFFFILIILISLIIGFIVGKIKSRNQTK
jgi:hypothetical protein